MLAVLLAFWVLDEATLTELRSLDVSLRMCCCEFVLLFVCETYLLTDTLFWCLAFGSADAAVKLFCMLALLKLLSGTFAMEPSLATFLLPLLAYCADW